MPDITVRDTAYVGLGLAVLSARQFNEAVAEIEKRVTDRNERIGKAIEQGRERAEAVRAQVEELVTPYVERIQARFDTLVERLPEPAQKTYKDAVAAGKEAAAGLETFARKMAGVVEAPVPTRDKKATGTQAA